MTVPTMTPAGWYPDPSLRHEFRYWDGMAWSSQVSDRGRMATAPDQGPWTNLTVAQRLDVLVASGSWIEVTELGRAEPQLLAERFLSEARRHPGEKVGAAGIPLSGQVSKPLTPSREDVRFS